MERFRYFVFNHRVVSLFLFGLVLMGVTLLFWLIPSLKNRGKVVIDVAAVPKDAVITLNNEKVRAGKNYVVPGDYSLKATHDGFGNYNYSFHTDVVRYLPVLLVPESDQAKEWAANNERSYAEVEGRAGELAQDQGLTFYQKNPITSQLPFRSLYFDIDYQIPKDNNENVVLEITASSALGRQFAVKQIRDWGFEPTDYSIEFKEFRNPLKVNSQ